MTNFVCSVTATGRLFQASNQAIAEIVAEPKLDAASRVLADGIRQAAPKASRQLVGKIQTAGFGFAKRVQAAVPYAIPLDKGAKPGFTPIRPLQLWAELRIGLSEAEARKFAFAWSRVRSGRPQPGLEFFYRTFDRLAPMLSAQFLVPIASGIVEELEK